MPTLSIDSVTTAVKCGEVVINQKQNKANLSIVWEDVSFLTDNAGRVYLLCVDGIVKKIGGSVSKGGIKSTMSFYTSGNTGRPSIRSFGINLLMYNEISNGSKVEVYLINSKPVTAEVTGLFNTTEQTISAFKEMEEQCISDYIALTGGHPDWNYQEQGKAWEGYIQHLHAEHIANH